MTLIRYGTPDDAEPLWQLRIDAILAQCTGHYPAALLQAWTDGSPSPRYREEATRRHQLIEEQGHIVACGMLDLATGQIDAIFVSPSQMGKGLGLAMMQHLEAQARHAGLAVLKLDATLNAAPFYRKLGFVGDALSQYHSPRGFTLDCIPMQKQLG